MTAMSDPQKLVVDVASVSGLGASLLNWLPGVLEIVATLFTIWWTAIRIYETKTVQRWIAKQKDKHGVRI